MAPGFAAGFGVLKVILRGILLAMLLSSSVNALDRVSVSEGDLKASLEKSVIRLEQLSSKVRAQAKLYHALNEGSHGSHLLWIDENAVGERRKGLSKMTQVGIRITLFEMQKLKAEIENLKTELEWSQIHSQSAPASEFKGSADRAAFKCQKLPFIPLNAEKFNLVQDFGRRRDADTGLEWTSTGWWVSEIKSEVTSCAPGLVVFSGAVVGRGRVVILDHGQGALSVYANLGESDPSHLPAKGTRVKAGAPIGSVASRLYFEVRMGSDAINPRKVLAGTTLSHLAF